MRENDRAASPGPRPRVAYAPIAGRRSFLRGLLTAVATGPVAACGPFGGSARPDAGKNASQPSSGESDDSEQSGQDLGLAPDFLIVPYQGAQELGGGQVRLSELLARGRPVVLNFWAGLCPPCRAEMPDFQDAYEARRHEVAILGVDVGPYVGLGSNGDGCALARKLQLTYPLATTPDSKVVRDFRLMGMPSSFFISPDGQIRRRRTGILNRDLLNQLIDELIELA